MGAKNKKRMDRLRGEKVNAREGMGVFRMRYFIVAVRRAPQASTVKKTKTTTSAMKRAVDPRRVLRVCSKLHENPIVVPLARSTRGRDRDG